MFRNIRAKFRNIQNNYEKILETRSVFGFSKIYADAMQSIRERQSKQHKEDND